MKNHEVEAKIKNAYTRQTPDVLQSVLSDLKAQEGKVIVMERKIKMSRWAKRASLIAAVFVLMAGGFFGYQVYDNNYAVASTISFDVNPSIEVKVNQKEKVLSVTPLNEDGKTVVGDMDFTGNSLDVTVNALIGSMLRNGYLDELANSILVSVDNNDPQKGAELQAKLMEEINSLLNLGTFEGAVLSQVVAQDSSLEQLADQYGITLGKAQLIQKIAEQNSVYTFESLVPLSINELNLLIGSGSIENVEAVGTASDKAYIGTQKAKEIALEHAGVEESAAFNIEIDLDFDNGKMVYEVEFHTMQNEYQYDIDAATGEIVKSEKELEDDKNAVISNGVSSGSYISEQEVKDIVLKHAGVSESSVNNYQIDLDTDDGLVIYDVDFRVGQTEYDYEVNAATGAVIKYEKDIDDDVVQNTSGGQTQTTASANTQVSSNTQTSSGTDYIGEAKAKEIALNHAGVSSGNISGYKAKLDRDDGIAVYEIEFWVDRTEYDYEINATTGAVVKNQKEIDDDIPVRATSSQTVQTSSSTQTSSNAQSYIGEQKAKEIALNHAGVSEGSIRGYKAKLDRDDGVTVYEIEFWVDWTEYDYEVNAATGTILKSQKEIDDDAPISSSSTSGSSASYIGEAKAKELALNHAGVSADSISNYKIKLDRDDGVVTYEIEFRVGRTEYDYEINASSGSILKSEKDFD